MLLKIIDATARHTILKESKPNGTFYSTTERAFANLAFYTCATRRHDRLDEHCNLRLHVDGKKNQCSCFDIPVVEQRHFPTPFDLNSVIHSVYLEPAVNPVIILFEGS